MWWFLVFLFFHPYEIHNCYLEDLDDKVYAFSAKEAIDSYMEKWYPILGSCGGPFCVKVNGKEYEINVQRKFIIDLKKLP